MPRFSGLSFVAPLAQPFVVRVAVVFLCVGLARPAIAQVSDLPASLVQASGQVDAGGEGQIRAFIADPLANIAGDDPEKIRSGRSRLLDMVGPQRAPSVPFRFAFSKVLSPELEKLMGQGEMAQINALVIAGELATPDSLVLLDKGRKSELASVRFQAAAGAGRTISIFNQGSASAAVAIAPNDMLGLLRALGSVLRTEQDNLVLDKTASALVAAVSNPQLREEALKQLDEGLFVVAGRFKGSAVPVEVLQTFAQVSSDLRQALLVVGGGALPQGVTRSAAGVAGTVAWLTNSSIKARKVETGAAGEAMRSHVAAAAGAAESMASFLTKSTEALDLAGKARKATSAGDAEFVEASGKLLALVQSRAGVSADRYK